jgi:molybdopterin converting factor small subunit
MADRVTLRYWAAAKEAAGVAEEQLDGAPTLGALLSLALARRPDDARYARVLAHCSFVVDGQPLGRRAPMDVPLQPGSVVEALPPFAGG